MKRGFVFAAIHFCTLMFVFGVSYGATMERFDTGEEPSAFERLAARATEVLGLPSSAIWTSWMSKNLPDILEWMLVVANSLLWGFTAAVVQEFLCRKRRTSYSGTTKTANREEP